MKLVDFAVHNRVFFLRAEVAGSTRVRVLDCSLPAFGAKAAGFASWRTERREINLRRGQSECSELRYRSLPVEELRSP